MLQPDLPLSPDFSLLLLLLLSVFLLFHSSSFFEEEEEEEEEEDGGAPGVFCEVNEHKLCKVLRL